MHIEAAINLNSEESIDSFSILLPRCGILKNAYSGRGTNFMGTRRTLNEIETIVLSNHQSKATPFFKPILPAAGYNQSKSLHFGGLWAAGIKFIEIHFEKFLGNSSFNFWIFVCIEYPNRCSTEITSYASHLWQRFGIRTCLNRSNFLACDVFISIPDLPDELLKHYSWWMLLQNLNSEISGIANSMICKWVSLS